MKKKDLIGKRFSANINGKGVVEGKIFEDGIGALFATKEIGGWSLSESGGYKHIIKEGYSYGWYNAFVRNDELSYYRLTDLQVFDDYDGKHFSGDINRRGVVEGKIFYDAQKMKYLFASKKRGGWGLKGNEENPAVRKAIKEGYSFGWWFNYYGVLTELTGFTISEPPTQTTEPQRFMKRTKIHYKNLPSGEVLITGFENVATMDEIERIYGKAVRDKYDWDRSGNRSYYRLIYYFYKEKRIFITPDYCLSEGDVISKSKLEFFIELMREAGETLKKIRKEVWAEERRKREEGFEKIHTIEI